jgi:hypothetical protein
MTSIQATNDVPKVTALLTAIRGKNYPAVVKLKLVNVKAMKAKPKK